MAARDWSVIYSSRYTKNWRFKFENGADRNVVMRNGDVGFIMAHWILNFHQTIERLNSGVFDEWGWAIRSIRGPSSKISDHARAIAVDLNSTQHPMGVRRTFYLWQVAKIRAKLRFRYRGQIGWGGNWNSPDDMHFWYRGTRAKANRLAKRLRRTKRGRKIMSWN